MRGLQLWEMIPAPALWVYLQSTGQPALESDQPHLSKPRWSAQRWWWWPSAQSNTWNYCFTPMWTCRACASSAEPATASCSGAQVVLQWGDHGHWDCPLATPWSSQWEINPPVHICFQIKKGLKAWKKLCSCSVCKLFFVHSSSPFQHYLLALCCLLTHCSPSIQLRKSRATLSLAAERHPCKILCSHSRAKLFYGLWMHWGGGGEMWRGNGSKYCREIMRERVV